MSGSDQFDGRSILIVGATGAVGTAISRRLACEGAALTLVGRNESKLHTLGKDLNAAPLVADVTQPEGRLRVAAEVGALDGWVFAAGVAPLAPVRYLKDGVAESCHAVNATAPLLLARELLKQKKIRPGASLVWISSVAAVGGTAGYAVYAGSKAALEAHARCLAVELAPKGIRVNCIAPGMLDSEMAADAGEAISEEALKAHTAAYPLGIGNVRDVAGAVSFLLSHDARWVTGITLPMDGGCTL